MYFKSIKKKGKTVIVREESILQEMIKVQLECDIYFNLEGRINFEKLGLGEVGKSIPGRKMSKKQESETEEWFRLRE